MRVICAALMLPILVSILASGQFVFQAGAAVEWVPGVRVGDWAKYVMSFTFSTNDPAPPLSIPDWVGNIEFFRIEVLSVTGAGITFRWTTHFKNGTELSYVQLADVSGESFPFLLYFIAANLSAGDPLYPFPGCTFILNATLTRVYAGALREVNYLGFAGKGTYPEGSESVGKSDTFWDRESGIIMEIDDDVKFTKVPEGYTTNVTSSILLIETNIWAREAVSAKVGFFPKLLNLRSQGKWLMAVIRLPEGYYAGDVNVSTIMLNDTIPAEPLFPGSRNGRGSPLLMVKFDRRSVINLIMKNCPSTYRFGKVTLTITGVLKDSVQFRGSDTVWIAYMRFNVLHPASKPLSYR